MKDYFAGDLVGQTRVRRQLSFYLDVYRKTSVFKNSLFLAQKGDGKTLLSRKIAEKLGKEYYEINAGTIKSVTGFYEQVIEPCVIDKECTLMIDEIHALDKRVVDFLLSMLAPSRANRNKVRFGAAEFDIDFRQFTFLCATTEGQRLFPALKSRLKQITLSAYSQTELMAIIQVGAGAVNLPGPVLEYLSRYIKRNGRSAFELGQEVEKYALVVGKASLDLKGARELISILNLYEHGFTELEVQILESVARARNASLTRLAAKSGLTPSAQRDFEREMLANDLIDIQGGRRITRQGIEYLQRNSIN